MPPTVPKAGQFGAARQEMRQYLMLPRLTMPALPLADGGSHCQRLCPPHTGRLTPAPSPEQSDECHTEARTACSQHMTQVTDARAFESAVLPENSIFPGNSAARCTLSA